MSAEILREAASLMRERAVAAIDASGDESWKADGIAWNDNRGTVYMVGAGPVNVCDAITEEQAEHIAAANPPFMLAVADWLAECGRLWEYGDIGPLMWKQANAVARAYLGEPA